MQAGAFALFLATFFLAATGLVLYAVNLPSLAGEVGGHRRHTHPLHLLYLFPITVQLVYSIGRLPNLFRTLVATRFFTWSPKGGKIVPQKEPGVTIQICAYNEGDVVEETINHACQVDWPREKLFIHVCDDSTDQESIAVIGNAVSVWKAKGIQIEHLRRPHRIGYKAGNLRYHFDSVQTDYVAHFDADHRMEKDFLRRSMPFFYDPQGEVKPKIGLVQSAWAYYNIHQNLLTETGKPLVSYQLL